jgi:hypothetical protein
MSLPSSGQISASTINEELIRPTTSVFSLAETTIRGLANKPAGTSTISFIDFYGKSFTYVLGPISGWSYQITQFNVDQGPAYNKTWDDTNKITFPLNRYDNFLVTSAAEGRLFARLYTTNDANNICQTNFVWSLFGKTYKLINESYRRILQVKNLGAPDSSYVTTLTRNFTSASGYSYMQIEFITTQPRRGRTQVNGYAYIGNPNGFLDLSQMPELINFEDGSNFIKPETSYLQNFHYNGQTGQWIYPLSFTKS